MTTWADLLAGATAQLTAAGVDSPAADARWLAEAVAGKRPHPRDTPPPAQRELFAAYLARRAAREPLQHITGRMYFRYLELVSTPDALIVRPETEIVAECAIAHVRACVAAQNCGNAASLKNDDAAAARSRAAATAAGPLVVDLGTGSGAIALSIATEVPAARVIGVDADPQALQLAATNNARYGSPVTFLHHDVAEPLPELDHAASVVVANPPYIPPDTPVSVEVRADPARALWGGGAEGLDLPKLFVARAAQLLRGGGILVLEHAETQSAALREYARSLGFTRAATGRDLAGRERFLEAEYGHM
ncbi:MULTISPECIES: N5-glutamine methyltransferase family protein [Actinotignum]|uniref:HemK/PrmC family methyltransferase n=4 Tax=Actinotignum timonense TaxID=1870995 RepID=A0AAW9HAX5_9ACTO|nr:HemK/PrmC family methyltransferase [Actinotignum timonense]MBS5748273.1 peptide chain release factor N(5)-glutamine methyltransferase [Actinotignum schaalii]MDK6374259.1 HemK/PrmC family methyltransferase [Actinotignum timonense]MDK6418125.1 HemK/PrmC family methyltransferase [Actinotignum timonense]MDK6630004.1 HemK/PrmC family methyltransferase [Actinotignum timonense]MDK6644634.1 HemK/PrmC family methyltransferase [Actinotignum timonense]